MKHLYAISYFLRCLFFGLVVSSVLLPVNAYGQLNPFDNSSFEQWTSPKSVCGGSYRKPSNWNYKDCNNEGSLSRSQGGQTDGQYYISISWTGNGGNNNSASIWQDVNLAGIDSVKFDMIGPGGGNPQRSDFVVLVDSTQIKNCGYVNNNDTDSCAVDVSQYSGNHEFKIKWDQRSGDNLGNAGIDYLRVVIGGGGKYDVGVSNVMNPQSGCGLDSGQFEVQVTNYGDDTIAQGDTLPINYQINNGKTYKDTHYLASKFAPLNSRTIGLRKLSAIDSLRLDDSGTYSIKAWTGYPADTTPSNDTITKSVKIKPVPDVPTTINDTFCLGNSATLIARHSDSAVNINWYDQAKDGNKVDQGDTFETGVYYGYDTFSVEAENQQGCASERKSIVPGIQASGFGKLNPVQPFGGTTQTGLSFDPDTLCVGDTATYELKPPKGYSNAGLGNSWYIDSVVFQTKNGYEPSNTLFKPASGGSNTTIQYVPSSQELDSFVKIAAYVGLEGISCDTILERYVQVGGQVIADFGIKDACSDSTYFINKTQPANAGLSYAWDFGDGDNGSGKNPIHHYGSKPQTYTITLTAKGGGCSDKTTKSVKIQKELTPDFGIQGPRCQQQKVSFQDSTRYKGNGTLTHKWFFGDGDSLVQQSPSYTFEQPKTYDVKLRVEDGLGCRDSIVKPVAIKVAPITDFGVIGRCRDEKFSFIDSTTIAGNTPMNYNWQFPDTNYNKANVNHRFSNHGAFDVQLVVDASTGCTDTASESVDVAPVPKAHFGEILDCYDEPIRFIDSTDYAGTDGLEYYWNFGDGDTSIFANPSHDYNAPGHYQITHAVNNTVGCSDTIVDSIEAYAYPDPGFAFANKCFSTEVAFTNETGLAAGDSSGIQYSWDFDGLSGSSQESPEYEFPDTGRYQITLEATYKGMCKSTLDSNIKVDEAPRADFEITHPCIGQNTRFELTSGDAYSYDWSFGDGQTDSVKNPSHIYDTAGNYEVRLLTGYDSNRCYDTVFKQVTIHPTPEASFEVSDTLCAGQDVIFNNTTDTVNVSSGYNWDFGDEAGSQQRSPSHQYADSGEYQVALVAKGTAGCNDTASQSLQVYSKPESDFTISDEGNLAYQFLPEDSTLAAYEWRFGDGEKSDTTIPKHTYSKEGIYEVELKGQAVTGCWDTTRQSIAVTTNIENAAFDDRSVKVYPNPFDDKLYLQFHLEKKASVTLQFYSTRGKLLMRKHLGRQQIGDHSIDIKPGENVFIQDQLFLVVKIDDQSYVRQLMRK